MHKKALGKENIVLTQEKRQIEANAVHPGMQKRTAEMAGVADERPRLERFKQVSSAQS